MIEPLIERLNPNEANMIMEVSNTTKNLYLKGIFMQADLKNRNGRIYPLSEMVREVSRINQSIAENGLCGELDHPQDLNVTLRNISHVITELKMDGINVIGKAKIIREVPMGAIAEGLIKAGIRLGVSSRGAGNVSSDGIVESFNLITIDLVSTPSAPGATPNTVYESLQSKTGMKVMTLAEQWQHDDAAQKYFKKEMLKFIKETFNTNKKAVKIF